MSEIDPEFTSEQAARVIRQFETSQYSDTIGMRKRSAWIKHLKLVFKNKFSRLEEEEYERLTELLAELE